MEKQLSSLLYKKHKPTSRDNFINYLAGNKDQRNFTRLFLGKRVHDIDRDGVPDVFDCQPRNPKKDAPIVGGLVGSLISKITAPSKPSQPSTPSITPSPITGQKSSLPPALQKPTTTPISSGGAGASAGGTGGVTSTPSITTPSQPSIAPTAPSQPSPQVKENKVATYDSSLGGVVTSDGKFYPTTNPNWLPPGYSQGYGYTTQQGIGVGTSGGLATISPAQKALATKISEEIKLGKIQGFSGTTLTSQEIAKKQLLEQMKLIKVTPTYQEYYKGTTPESMALLKQYSEAERNRITLSPKEQFKAAMPEETRIIPIKKENVLDKIGFTGGKEKNIITQGRSTIFNAYEQAKRKAGFTGSEETIIGKGRGVLERNVPFFPRSPEEVAVLSAAPFLIGALPTVVQTGLTGYFTYAGARTAFGKGSTVKERIEGGIMGIGGAIGLASVSGRLFNVARTRLSPKYAPTTEEGIIVKSKIPGRETVTIPLAKESASKLGIPLSEQAAIAGTTQDVVSGSTRFFDMFNRQRTISKPIPVSEGYPGLSEATKLKIERFTKDPKSFTDKEILDLNKLVIKETGSKGLLESQFFVDPYGRLRTSRLGIVEKQATTSDVFSGQFTFKKPKPQALLFEQTKIQEFPPELKSIQAKLIKGESLNELEQAKLLRFQFEKSGQFKPVGFLTREPEATLATGEILKRSDLAGVTLITPEGKIIPRRVEIIRPEILKQEVLTPETLKLLEKKDLTIKEQRILNERLTKETGFSYNQKPYLDPYKLSGDISILAGTNVYTSSVNRISTPSQQVYQPSSYEQISVSTSPISKAYSISAVSPKAISGVSTISEVSRPSGISKPSDKLSSQIYPSVSKPISKAPYKQSSRGTSYYPGEIIKQPRQEIVRFPTYFKPKEEVTGKRKAIVEIRRKGKFVQVSKPVEIEQAFGIGLQKVKSSLAASFRVREAGTGRVIRKAPGSISPQFRISKKEEGVIIQRTGFRLGSLFERKEITKAKQIAQLAAPRNF